MQNKYYFAAAAVVAFALWRKGSDKVAKATQVIDSVPLAGGDFVGDTWSRLNGADLVAAGYPNIGGNLNADPGRIGVMNLGLNTSWNGTIQ